MALVNEPLRLYGRAIFLKLTELLVPDVNRQLNHGLLLPMKR